MSILYRCSGQHGCGRLLPPAAFHRKRNSKRGGRMYTCKTCRSLYARFKKARYRARLRGVVDTVTWEAFYAAFHNVDTCYYCGGKLASGWELDHIKPLSAMGANSLENLCASCPTCHRAKGNMLPVHWYGWLAQRGVLHPDAVRWGVTDFQVSLIGHIGNIPVVPHRPGHHKKAG